MFSDLLALPSVFLEGEGVPGQDDGRAQAAIAFRGIATPQNQRAALARDFTLDDRKPQPDSP